MSRLGSIVCSTPGLVFFLVILIMSLIVLKKAIVIALIVDQYRGNNVYHGQGLMVFTCSDNGSIGIDGLWSRISKESWCASSTIPSPK